ncbi:unnamed protein product, partial [Cyprideis torosa]
MSIRVKCLRASGLPDIERFGKVDPYVQLELQGEKVKTEVISDTTEPEWNEIVELKNFIVGQPGGDCIDVFVKDYEKIGRNRLLGKCMLSIHNILQSPGNAVPFELPLVDKDDRPTSGVLNLEVTYTGAAPGAPDATASATTYGMVLNVIRGAFQAREAIKGLRGASTPVPTGRSAELRVHDEIQHKKREGWPMRTVAYDKGEFSGSAVGAAAGGPGAVAAVGTSGAGAVAVASAGGGDGKGAAGIEAVQKSQSASAAIQQALLARAMLPDVVTLFQIRVKVVEARQLQ